MREEPFVNSLGMKFLPIPAGTFLMGQPDGEIDEKPVHAVRITVPFHIGFTQVTNAQYERFAPDHRELRGARGISKEDGEAVVFVSWEEACAFCGWLSEKEGKPYRLPTEAEWEYACRAGTTTPYSTGLELPGEFHRNQENVWDPEPVSLAAGKTPPNPWGICDMHGNVEEWCLDWYGPYPEEEAEDPVGCEEGEFRVSRGGSHNTGLFYLRSANRQGTLPGDRNWLIGFRVVCAAPPPARPCARERRLWQVDVEHPAGSPPPAGGAGNPVFTGPLRYIGKPRNASVPMYGHNHCPSVCCCDNGDLLAVWFSCESELGREMSILGSRLRRGRDSWDPPDEFFNAPDRNMTGSSLFNCEGVLYHFNGLDAAYGHGNMALVMRTSRDDGETWSRPRLINPEHGFRNQVISGTIRTAENFMLQACDADPGPRGGTALYLSRDGGDTWTDHGAGKPRPDFAESKTGAWIAGIHAGVVQLDDGRLMALGRGDNIKERMPMSISDDMGKTWRYRASEFPPISGGQRLALLRLREGPIMLASFTDRKENILKDRTEGMMMADREGNSFRGYGLFASLSFDNGETWPIRKLITPGGGSGRFDGGAWTGEFSPDQTHAEPRGYLAAVQSPEGIIHLVSSALHYRFNLAWLEAPVIREKSRGG